MNPLPPQTAGHRRPVRRGVASAALLGSLLALSACGADVATATTTVAHTEAQAARAALAQQDRMMKALEQASQQTEERLRQTDQ